MSLPPEPCAEITAADWAAAGPGWSRMPYLARFAGRRLPASWLRLLNGRESAVLESGPTGRYTVVVPEAARVTVMPPGQDALGWLDRWSTANRAPRLSGWPPFQGGLIVALGYELAGLFEPVASAPADLPLPRAIMLEADEAFIHDRVRDELTVVVLCRGTDPAANALEAAARSARRLARLWDIAMGDPAPEMRSAAEPVPVITASFGAEEFAAAVRAAQALIAAGDTYQVNLSTRLELSPPPSGILAYEAVRATNPSPYMGYIRTSGVELVCGSPELLVSVFGARIASRPIAGTRPRTGADTEDGAFARELAADSKERAEHLMLVDLIRNDLGRVAQPGTVRVPEFMAVERYSHVMHLVSQVEGDLSTPPPPPSALLRSTFPGGTVTGAPKVRTMQIIADLEPVARGFYTGSVGWIAASGDLCLNIVIRTLTLASGRCFAQAGAGVVADSSPEREHAESLRKALALRVALGRVSPS